MAASEAQTSLRLPQELRDRLGSVAIANGRSVGEEIRRRLETSFGSVADAKTAELFRLIAIGADHVAKTCGPWHENPYAFAVIKTLVAELIEQQRPEGEPMPPAGAGAAYEGPPEQAGRVLASLIDLF